MAYRRSASQILGSEIIESERVSDRHSLVAFAEGLGAAKTYAAEHHYEVDANRELLGLGAANLGAGFSGGMVVGGSLSKTAVNDSAGAKTQVSGLTVAGLTVLTLFFSRASSRGFRRSPWPRS